MPNALREVATHGLGTIVHTPLFALKAINLDDQLKLKLGTIMGYGKIESYQQRRRTIIAPL